MKPRSMRMSFYVIELPNVLIRYLGTCIRLMQIELKWTYLTAIADSNEITGFMLVLLDQVKSSDVEIDTPMNAVALMMVKRGVSEQEVADV